MIEFLKRIFIGHSHVWEIIEEGTLVNKNKVRIGAHFTLQCKHCGDLQYKKFY